MGGICAIVNFDGAPVDPEVLRRMTEVVSYRGPDGIHYLVEGNVGLAHLALYATPEAVRERQPLTSPDGLFTLVADARVDNRPELIEMLRPGGWIRMDDPTDADLILAAYARWGEDCPVQLVGDFAFAIWDRRERLLFCARDALGVKPLHHAQVGSSFCAASEARQILRNPRMRMVLDETAMARSLVNDTSDQESTFFADVYRLPPAHHLVAAGGSSRATEYWRFRLDAPGVRASGQEHAERFLHVFRRAVSDRLRGVGGPVGLSMSGGLDSCSIAGVGQQILGADRRPSTRLIAASWVFDECRSCDERKHVEGVARYLGLDVCLITGDGPWQLVGTQVPGTATDTPPNAWEHVMRELLAVLRARKARVLLTGSARYYGRFVYDGLSYLNRLVRGDVSVLPEMRQEARDRGMPVRRLLMRQVAKPLLHDACVAALPWMVARRSRVRLPVWVDRRFAERTGVTGRLAERETRYYVRDLSAGPAGAVEMESVGRSVCWLDGLAQEYGIEPRHPYLDRRVVSLLRALPPGQSYRAGWNRAVVRDAMDGVLPDDIRWRRDKTVFNALLHRWLCGSARPAILQLLGNPVIGQMGMVDPARLRTEYDGYCNASPRGSSMLLGPLMLELWLRSLHLSGDTPMP